MLRTASGVNGDSSPLLPGAGFEVFTTPAGTTSEQFIIFATAGTTATLRSVNTSAYVIPTQKGKFKNYNFASPSVADDSQGWVTYAGVTLAADGKAVFDGSKSPNGQIFMFQRPSGLDTTKQHKIRVSATITQGSLKLITDSGQNGNNSAINNGITDILFTPSASSDQFIFSGSADVRAFMSFTLLDVNDANFPTP